jgi:phosphatidylglycerol:prolipoprotein diacylglycerol transferase
VLIQFGSFVIRWYGVMMATTILVSLWLAYRWGPRFGVDRPLIDRIAWWLIIALFVGARLGYVVSHPAEFRDPLEILRVWHGGLSSHGAIAAGLLFVLLIARRTGRSMWSLADTFAWTIPLGNIFVRFGNFANGELYGDPTTLPWGFRFPTVPGGPRHPLQLYEMLLAAIILLVASPIARRRAFPGQVWWGIVVLTSVGRVLLDLLRSEMRLWGILTAGQIPAVLLIVAGVWFLRRLNQSGSARQSRLEADASR